MGLPTSWIGEACKQEERGKKERFCKGMNLDKVRNTMVRSHEEKVELERSKC